MNYPSVSITITLKAEKLANKILDSGNVSQEKFVGEFEEKFADLL